MKTEADHLASILRKFGVLVSSEQRIVTTAPEFLGGPPKNHATGSWTHTAYASTIKAEIGVMLSPEERAAFISASARSRKNATGNEIDMEGDRQ